MFTLQGQVYPLADVLDTELTMIVKGNTSQLVTKGEVRKVPVGDAFLTLINTVKASFVSDEIGSVGSAVLMRVAGDLYIYGCYASQNNRATIFILDAEKQAITPQVAAKINGASPHYAMRELLPAVVARYTSTVTSDSEWEKELVHADIVGFGKLSGESKTKAAS